MAKEEGVEDATVATAAAPIKGVKTLAVDYGTKRVGLAVSMGIAPRPLAVLPHGGDDEALAKEIVLHARAEGARNYVVGLPLNRDGSETYMSGLARLFAARLATHAAAAAAAQTPASRTPPRVSLWDERFSSLEAEARVANRGAAAADWLDSIAACIILEHYFGEQGVGAEVVISDDAAFEAAMREDDEEEVEVEEEKEERGALKREPPGLSAAEQIPVAAASSGEAAGAAAHVAVHTSGGELLRQYEEARRAAMLRAAESSGKRPPPARQSRRKRRRWEKPEVGR